ncbi:hypothetical protein BGX23_011082 [Mortierella sp. AD031]|nr:hypothetical protein BGX23_011082 [Mortierella sp. AD031]
MAVTLPGAGGIMGVPMPITAIEPPLLYYSFVWSTQRSAMLLYGGHGLDGLQDNPVLRRFNTTTDQWSDVNTTGTSPGDVGGHCMVPDGIVVNETLLIYNIKDDRWVTEYTPLAATNNM